MKNGWLPLHSSDKWKALQGLMCISIPSCFFFIVRYKSNVENEWVNLGLRMQSNWDRILDTIGDDKFNLYVYGMNMWLNVLYWSLGLTYLVVETYRPKWLIRYKIQPKVVIDRKRLHSLIVTNLTNQLFVTFPYSIVCYCILKYQGTSAPARELPTFLRFVVNFALLVLIQEVLSYYIHRMVHHRLVYKWIHKKHHEWKSPIALSAYYNAPLDHLILNMVPASVGLPLTNAHFFTSFVWLTWATIRTLSDHSGYYILPFPSPRRRDFHHLKFTECFGVWGPLDYLHGTETLFRASTASGKLTEKSN